MKISWGTSIVIVYTLFALGTLSFVAFAMTTSVNLVSSDYYEQALQHDAIQQARSRAVECNAKIILADGAVKLQSTHIDHAAQTIELYWIRAQDPEMDTLWLVPSKSLLQHGVATESLARGRWSLRVLWEQGGQKYQIDTVATL